MAQNCVIVLSPDILFIILVLVNRGGLFYEFYFIEFVDALIRRAISCL